MQELIFVTGMGRSGTSAITRLLSLCGAKLPPSLVPAASDNPQGFWEPSEAIALNDHFLGSWGSSWYDPGLNYAGPADTSDFVDSIATFLRGGFPDAKIGVLKDPRISGLLDFWLEAARRAGFRVKVLHIFRNPNDVASSLSVREGMMLEHSQALWLKYNLKAERDTRYCPRVFVSYEQLMGDAEWALERCIKELRLDLAIEEDTRKKVREFTRRDLQHHRTSSTAGLTDRVPSRWVRGLHKLLEAAALGASPIGAEFDDLFDEISACQNFMRSAMAGYESARLEYDAWLRRDDIASAPS